ncbi:MAG: DNA primase, partial [Chitinophagales bacterium]
MIPPDIVAQIHEIAQVEEVLSDFLSLKKRGANYIACCPFHNEKTPSFTVSPAKNIYKCFGCGKAGNSVKFVMEHENMTYPESLRHIAKRYNIEIPEAIRNEEAEQAQKERDSLFIVNNFALSHFQYNLENTDEGRSVGLGYFKERGFSPETIEKFQLGYSLNDFETFVRAAKSKGFRLDLMEQLGLLRSKNERKYPFFRARVMFTIHNLSGKVIAFAGRTLSKDKKIPKYINSPETEIYNKSNVLYAMHLAKGPIRKLDQCFLVEG